MLAFFHSVRRREEHTRAVVLPIRGVHRRGHLPPLPPPYATGGVEHRRPSGTHLHLPDRRAGVHPRGGRAAVDAHGAEAGEVDHGEHLLAHGPVREALVVVPAAAHAEAHPVAAAAQHGGLDVRRVGGLHDAERPHGAGRQEPRVPDGRRQHRRERRRAPRDDELARHARGE
ncbi:Os06g0549525, partial [Oryza sativa Japonica Group]